MAQKQKGSNAERELVRLFWGNNWAAIRVAGSGSSRFPCPDVIARNNNRTIAVECKSTKSTSKYIEKDEIAQLTEFSRVFGAEPWIGFRFSKQEWLFIPPENLRETAGHVVVSLTEAKSLGLSFSELVEKG